MSEQGQIQLLQRFEQELRKTSTRSSCHPSPVFVRPHHVTADSNIFSLSFIPLSNRRPTLTISVTVFL